MTRDPPTLSFNSTLIVTQQGIALASQTGRLAQQLAAHDELRSRTKHVRSRSSTWSHAVSGHARSQCGNMLMT